MFLIADIFFLLLTFKFWKNLTGRNQFQQNVNKIIRVFRVDYAGVLQEYNMKIALKLKFL